MDCPGIQREFDANETLINGIIQERTGQNVKNVALTAASVIFLPTLFFLDLKGAERSEISSLRSRNQVLVDIAKTKKCPEPQSKLDDFYKQFDNAPEPKR